MMSLNTNKQLIGKKINSSHSMKVAYWIKSGVKLAPLLVLALCGFAYEQTLHSQMSQTIDSGGLVGAPVDIPFHISRH